MIDHPSYVRCWRCGLQAMPIIRTDGDAAPPGWTRWLVCLPNGRPQIIYSCPDHPVELRGPATATVMA